MWKTLPCILFLTWRKPKQVNKFKHFLPPTHTRLPDSWKMKLINQEVSNSHFMQQMTSWTLGLLHWLTPSLATPHSKSWISLVCPPDASTFGACCVDAFKSKTVTYRRFVPNTSPITKITVQPWIRFYKINDLQRFVTFGEDVHRKIFVTPYLPSLSTHLCSPAALRCIRVFFWDPYCYCA